LRAVGVVVCVLLGLRARPRELSERVPNQSKVNKVAVTLRYVEGSRRFRRENSGKVLELFVFFQ
jgi:hypothetical protein